MPIAGSNIADVMKKKPGNIQTAFHFGNLGNMNHPALGQSHTPSTAQPATSTPATGYGPNQNAKSSAFNAMFTRNPVFEQVGLSQDQAAGLTANPSLYKDFQNWYYTDPQGFLSQASINGGAWDPQMTPFRFRYPGTAGAPNVEGGFTPQPPAAGEDLTTLFQSQMDSLSQLLSGMGQQQQPQQEQGMNGDMMALLLSLIQGQGGGGASGGTNQNAGYIYGG